MADKNYLIGFGERLSRSITLKTGGGKKKYPWTFSDARKGLMPKVRNTISHVQALPNSACPGDQSVISLVLNPAFTARSSYPTGLLKEWGLNPIGSRAKRLYSNDKPIMTPEIFVAGSRSLISRIGEIIPNWHPAETIQQDFQKLLDIASLDETRLKPILGEEDAVPLEIVLHASDNDEDDYIIEGFRKYARQYDVKVDLDQRIHAGGLCFLPVKSPREVLADLTAYSFVRLIRRMPELSLNETILRTSAVPGSFVAKLPTNPPINREIRVAVFDGGGTDPNNLLKPWVQFLEANGLAAPTANYQRHGVAVTSALLFGPLEKDTEASIPYSSVDHWRVLDKNTGRAGDEFLLMNVLRRILDVLRQRKYDFICLSIGPASPIEDDPVHVWTSALDAYLSSSKAVLVSAGGNTGLDDWDSGNARIQPCSDAVNGIGVGATDSRGNTWNRAPYSSIGPGLSTSFVKPDLVAFGGDEEEPFWLLDHARSGHSAARMGTSYAAPLALRNAIGLRAHFGSQLTAPTIKALMIHHSSRSPKHTQREVGWGRLPTDLSDLVICPDGEVTVLYQGILEPSQHIRFQIPVPKDPIKNSIRIKATFCIFSPVDPEDSWNYTRAGLGITFRPSTVGSPGKNKMGKQRSVHESDGFFSGAPYQSSEIQKRKDAHKWSTVLKAEKEFKGRELDQPVFDVEHHARVHGQPGTRRTDISYSLVVTMASKDEPNLFNRVLSAYPGLLEIIRPSIEVPVRIR